jgi:D-alanyl-D-alanine dipeptidase
MQLVIYRRIFLIFGLIIFIFSCKKNTETKIHKNINCKIFCSSDNALTSESVFYKSSLLPKDDIIIFAFDTNIFIKKIIINQKHKTIKSIQIFTNKGFAGNFKTNNINFNDTVAFLILRISNVKNFLFTNFYYKSKKFKIAFDSLNKPLIINSITFFSNDTDTIKIKYQRPKNFASPKKKFCDYSKFPFSLSVSTAGQILGFSESKYTDTIYFGLSSKHFSKFIFTKNSVKIIKYTFKIIKNNKYYLKIKHIPLIHKDFPNNFFVDIKSLDTNIVEDIRYATKNNFTGKKIYPCGKCLLRYLAAKDFVAAAKDFEKLGYKIKVFDCYRPLSAQYKLWEAKPNINYVANPQKGSIHNRGAAVDMTIIDAKGDELDMGTPFDYFGRVAYPNYTNLADTILKNRNFMWSIMRKHHFFTIKTEWWHLSHLSCMKYKISNMPIPCKK